MHKIIVCNNSIKKEILKYLNDKPLNNISFMSMKEVINNYYFKYDVRAIKYLMDRYNYKYDVCIEYLNNLYYVENKLYSSEKLNKLVSLKQELDKEGLLIYNNLFKSYLINKKIVIIGQINKFEEKIINELKNLCEVEKKDIPLNCYTHEVYEFNNIEEEVRWVAVKICELIDSGISPKEIKISNINNDYINVIYRIFSMYNLKLQEKKNLYGMNITTSFLENYNADINITISSLKGKYNKELVNKIINIVNKYSFVDNYLEVKDLIVEDLKNTEIITNYDNQIEIVDYHNHFNNEYVFLMNFNEEAIPKKYQDIDYVNDDIKPYYLENTIEKNKLEKEKIINIIKGIKNLTITYKLKTSFNSFYPSSLITDMDLKVVIPSNDTKHYSKIMDEIKTCSMIDELVKYGSYNNDLDLYYNSYPIPYNTYSNKFTDIDINLDKLLLSYTSMNDYYKCSFKYYLKYILKVEKKDNNNLNKYIGSIFHFVLEKCLQKDINIDELINEYLHDNNINLSIKEKYFLNKLKEELENIINVIKKQDTFIKLKQRLYEEKVYVEFNKSTFMGVIDKVMYDNDIYAIIDYKTGNTDINLSLSKYGIDMQLPVYLYLAHKKFGGNIAGFYLNKILNPPIKYNSKLTYEKQYEKNLKLYGYSNTKYISDFDATYKDSSLIKSLKVKTDGNFYNYSKVLTNDEIEELIELVEDKIIECIEKIHKGIFDINPKNIDSKNIGCQYCEYKDICFMTNDDIVYLGGD